MVKTVAQVLGWVFILVGILGFVPGITTDGMLLGIFHVDAVHNIIHLVSGALGVYAASAGAKTAKMFLQVIGVVYAIVAILGFMSGDEPVLGFISNNMADTWLHVVIAVVALYYGFAGKADEA